MRWRCGNAALQPPPTPVVDPTQERQAEIHRLLLFSVTPPHPHGGKKTPFAPSKMALIQIKLNEVRAANPRVCVSCWSKKKQKKQNPPTLTDEWLRAGRICLSALLPPPLSTDHALKLLGSQSLSGDSAPTSLGARCVSAHRHVSAMIRRKCCNLRAPLPL